MDDDAKNDIRKNPAAVLLGRQGGLKGGVARARNLSAARRTEIARDAAKARWSRTLKTSGSHIMRWSKKLTRSDAQQETHGSRMPFLRFTKGDRDVDHATWFREVFFGDLDWTSSATNAAPAKEVANISIQVRLGDVDLGVREMTLDHNPERALNHRAPTTHLHFDEETRQALEELQLVGLDVVVERDPNGSYSLTVG